MELLELLHKKKRRIINKYFSVNDYDYRKSRRATSLLSDKSYIKKLYLRQMGKVLNLDNPKTFTEKLQWLKLYDRKPEYTKMVDKYAVREYIKSLVESKGNTCSDLGLNFIPLLGVWDRAEDIDFATLPNQFVLKCNHDNGPIICKNKNTFNSEGARNELRKKLKMNYYKFSREWPYKNVKRKVICEKYMDDGSEEALTDYKFFCFNGNVRLLYVSNTVDSKLYLDFFDENFRHLDLERKDHPSVLRVKNLSFSKPNKFEEMKKIAAILTQGIPSVRCDFYEINGEIYFGELTFFTAGGFIPFYPEEWDLKLGDMIDLPKKK